MYYVYSCENMTILDDPLQTLVANLIILYYYLQEMNHLINLIQMSALTITFYGQSGMTALTDALQCFQTSRCAH